MNNNDSIDSYYNFINVRVIITRLKLCWTRYVVTTETIEYSDSNTNHLLTSPVAVYTNDYKRHNGSTALVAGFKNSRRIILYKRERGPV